MAFVIGLMGHRVLKRMRDAGWKDENPPKELVPDNEGGEDIVTRMFWVDCGVEDLLSTDDHVMPTVEIHVRGGVAYAERVPPRVRVKIVDHDHR